jgi:hypothetical protein
MVFAKYCRNTKKNKILCPREGFRKYQTKGTIGAKYEEWTVMAQLRSNTLMCVAKCG